MKRHLPIYHRCILVLSGILLTTLAIAQHNPLIGAGNSYVNISKKTTGGFVQVGDTLEIRTNYFFGGTYNSANYATNGNQYRIWNVRYFDSVPQKTTMLTGVNDSLRLITNEGLTFRKYTLAAGDDAATFVASPPASQYQIRINIGANPNIPTVGSEGLLTNSTGASDARIGTYKPRLFGGLLITTAFRVVVSGTPGDTIILGAGKLVFQKTSGGADTVITATPYKIFISTSEASTLCGNALGNNLASEFGGTFDSGIVHNRVSGPIFSIPSYDYKPLYIGAQTSDGTYAIVNNTSPSASTYVNAKMRPDCSSPTLLDSCTKRMHGGFWDIMGDHTGTNDANGNGPTPPGSLGGYMLMVNADVVTSEAYRQLVTGLCPDTYYEYSAWLKNICKRCGIDSNSTSTFQIGVKPNLSFSIDGLDIYSTGELDSTGWVKKGFVFKTGPAQTSALISIRNNASGGGGNDWVIDDIAIGTCGPTMNLNYVPVLLGCNSGTVIDLADTVKYSYNPNYSWYKWERSIDGGLTWSDPPTPTFGEATPTLVDGLYQYVTNYPVFLGTAADSGHRYRVVVANSFANLSNPDCSFTDGNYTFLRLIDCSSVLDAQLVSLSATLQQNNTTQLNWIVSGEKDIKLYEIEKSSNGIHFIKAGTIKARNSNGLTAYYFDDAEQIHRNTYFRIKVYKSNGLHTYSKTVVVNRVLNFQVNALVNPFKSVIAADVILPEDGILNITLYDNFGRTIGKQQQRVTRGLNKVTCNNFNGLAKGLYYISFEHKGIQIQRRITKLL
ncbi:MAG TPA: hypothetical protein PKC39_01045 [Ferruginibacter sp.]|nr:hypothetical protein [Ferruginibacter sp.]HMP19518.1 hypothetical protein [Ferruginibacter sp.]